MQRRLSGSLVLLSILGSACSLCFACSDTQNQNQSQDGVGEQKGGELGIELGGEGAQSGEGQEGKSEDEACEQIAAEARLEDVYLAFAFDVSGSMGKLDQPNWWHDPTAKWTPVVSATSAFFEREGTEGIFASLSLFPAANDRCDAESYHQPEVEMQQLPSESFTAAFEAYENEVGGSLVDGDWRGGTPTLAAFEGTRDLLISERDKRSGGRYAVVLVTDGLPQDCSGVDLGDVEASMAELFDEGAGIFTYVIGIENPSTPPALLPEHWSEWGCGADDDEPCAADGNLDALNQLAQAGGTEAAFLIDTDDPNATQAAFAEAIEKIRTSAISCSFDIPAHPAGGSFDPDRIDVALTLGTEKRTLAYSPTCEGENAWRYDDEDAPRQIELCASSCAQVTGLESGKLDIQFLCEPRVDVR